jgi:hypothetical protein
MVSMIITGFQKLKLLKRYQTVPSAKKHNANAQLVSEICDTNHRHNYCRPYVVYGNVFSRLDHAGSGLHGGLIGMFCQQSTITLIHIGHRDTVKACA